MPVVRLDDDMRVQLQVSSPMIDLSDTNEQTNTNANTTTSTAIIPASTAPAFTTPSIPQGPEPGWDPFA